MGLEGAELLCPLTALVTLIVTLLHFSDLPLAITDAGGILNEPIDLGRST